MVSKSEKFFTVDLGIGLDNISVDHLKPAPVDNITHHLPDAPGQQVSSGLNAEATPFVPVIIRPGCAVQPRQIFIEDD